MFSVKFAIGSPVYDNSALTCVSHAKIWIQTMNFNNFGTSNFGHCTVKINQREILQMNTLWEKFFRSLSTISIGNSTVYCGIWD